jgi:hypothetical protein
MIDNKDFAKMQIMRMAQLEGFPRNEPFAVRELVSALQVFETAQSAERYVDTIVGHETRCPMPADIRREANRQIEEHEAANRNAYARWGPTPELCPDCKPWGAFGWIVRDGRYEGCPTCSQEHVDAIAPLIEMLNHPKHGVSPGLAHSAGPLHAILAKS